MFMVEVLIDIPNCGKIMAHLMIFVLFCCVALVMIGLLELSYRHIVIWSYCLIVVIFVV